MSTILQKYTQNYIVYSEAYSPSKHYSFHVQESIKVIVEGRNTSEAREKGRYEAQIMAPAPLLAMAKKRFPDAVLVPDSIRVGS